MPLTLIQAATIVDRALQKGRTLGLAPLTVIVLDAGGHQLCLKREDRSGILRVEIAYGKAWGALGMGAGTRAFFERAEQAPTFYTALAAASGGRVIPVPGGVLIRDADDEIIGSVGVSGDTSDHDELCAIAGIDAIGLTSQVGRAKIGS